MRSIVWLHRLLNSDASWLEVRLVARCYIRFWWKSPQLWSSTLQRVVKLGWNVKRRKWKQYIHNLSQCFSWTTSFFLRSLSRSVSACQRLISVFLRQVKEQYRRTLRVSLKPLSALLSARLSVEVNGMAVASLTASFKIWAACSKDSTVSYENI